MSKIYLRKIKYSDIKYFTKWWRDKELLKLTSGILKHISDQEVDKYFQNILKSKKDYHFIIALNKKLLAIYH